MTDGTPDNRLVDFYARRSSAKLYCAIVGNVVIPGGYGSNSTSPTISRSSEWRDLARAISSRGSLPGIQLTSVWPGFDGSRHFRARLPNEITSNSKKVANDIGSTDLASIFRALNDATELAKDAGFRHIQIHAAHGYLFNLLIDPGFNDRAPEAQQLIGDWARSHSKNNIETSIRVSLRTGDDEFDTRHRQTSVEQIVRLPFDFIDVSSGFYNIDKRLIYPSRPDILGSRREETKTLADRFPDNQFIFSGRALQSPEHDLPPNVHIGLCRDLIANPDYLVDRSWGCRNSGKCHYFSRGLPHITCSQW